MNWGALVEQAIGAGLTRLAVVVFVAGVAVGLAIALIRRNTRR